MLIEKIDGITKKNVELLKKLNINDTTELIEHYPYRYEMIKRANLEQCTNKDKIVVDGIVETLPNINFYSKRRNSLKFYIQTQNRRIQIVIYNRAYLKNIIRIGTIVTIIGTYDKDNEKIVASEIRNSEITETSIECIYHRTSGLSSKTIGKYVDQVLTEPFYLEDYIPDIINKKYNLLNKEKAILEIHKPSSTTLLKEARKKLIYEELFKYSVKVNYLKFKRKKEIGLSRKVEISKVDSFVETLPFKLTVDQLKTIKDIYVDMNGNNQMNRLIQGDVGSGKTIVAFVAIYINKLSGYQSAMMAPTEILAIQHYQNLINLFPKYNIKLLTGSTKAKDKKQIMKELEAGNIDILVGTHSLINNNLIYNKLGLVITDEQHRFGVRERTNLKDKGINPDILSLSATPIPRTYALTIYGDMDVSNIKTKPSGRIPIVTTLNKSSEIKIVLEKMYQELKLGHQIYVVAPLVLNEEDEVDKNDVDTLYNNMNRAFGSRYNILKLHGKMKPKEKEEVMLKFAQKEADILISTTVIEVGVDIRNATTIVIFNAEQFGLATLHQLRGRVGRNSLTSYCMLISDKATERLDILTKSNDGFVISEEDFKLRGSGDLFGMKQSGDMTFKLADIKRDFNILQSSLKDSLEYLNNNSKNDKYIKKILEENKFVS